MSPSGKPNGRDFLDGDIKASLTKCRARGVSHTCDTGGRPQAGPPCAGERDLRTFSHSFYGALRQKISGLPR